VKKDIRATALYREAEALHQSLRQPGTGRIIDAADIRAAPDRQHAVFAGTIVDSLKGTSPTRICEVDLVSGQIHVLTFGPNIDRLPKYSPDGRLVAFISDRRNPGDFQLYLLDPSSGAARPAPPVDGWVEYLHWSPDGRQILLGVAGNGADVAGGQGAVASKQITDDAPSWVPSVEAGDESYRWRRVWVYDLASDRTQLVGEADSNVWEAVWCTDTHFAAVVSTGPGEGLWYSARLNIVEVATGATREIYAPQDQLGWPTASRSGKHLVVVEAVCSDRWQVAGELRLIETISGKLERLDTQGVDITYTEWRSERQLLVAGHRGFEAVVGMYDISSRTFTEIWVSGDRTASGPYATVSGLDEAGDCVLVSESFVQAPEIGMIRSGVYHSVKSLDANYANHVKVIKAVERVVWSAPDGLEIQGWLLRPYGEAPHPLVMAVHGGPVWQWRPRWLGRMHAHVLMLLKRGYAVFFPNPRGSSGRGQEFARHVLGDMGGADTHDYLSGLDHLVATGIADNARLGVTGVSYGGFMTAWLITQDRRFAAAVPVAPTINQVTQHLISNIPHFVRLFLDDTYTNRDGKYFDRSPVMHAHKTKTPTLTISGALDRCTPPEEAVQFHSALLENGVESVLLTYPEEGHGIRKFPAAIDYSARLVAWFQQHMPSSVDNSPNV
jgi:dipeptidyl aminopeptidase/acylaminoacyl peptidase